MKPSAQPGVHADAALTEAINRLWVRFFPEIGERVAILERAAQAVAAGNLTPSRREAAKAAAHKLAGVLGTFRLARGTDLARKLELAFSRESAPEPNIGKHLAAIAADLRATIESRGSAV